MVVDAAEEQVGCTGGGELFGDVPGGCVVVDEEPAGLVRVEIVPGEIGEGEEVVRGETGRVENGAELRTEGEVRAGEVGEGNVESVWRGVRAEVC